MKPSSSTRKPLLATKTPCRNIRTRLHRAWPQDTFLSSTCRQHISACGLRSTSPLSSRLSIVLLRGRFYQWRSAAVPKTRLDRLARIHGQHRRFVQTHETVFFPNHLFSAGRRFTSLPLIHPFSHILCRPAVSLRTSIPGIGSHLLSVLSFPQHEVVILVETVYGTCLSLSSFIPCGLRLANL